MPKAVSKRKYVDKEGNEGDEKKVKTEKGSTQLVLSFPHTDDDINSSESDDTDQSKTDSTPSASPDSKQAEPNERDPTTVVDVPWIWAKNDKYLNLSNKDVGKWMLFYKKGELNSNWRSLTTLYNNGALQGVLEMKCSTNYMNPRSSDDRSGVIILYCSDSYDRKKIGHIGDTILNKSSFKGRINYKTDDQTRQGTRATGNKKNSTYYMLGARKSPRRLFDS